MPQVNTLQNHGIERSQGLVESALTRWDVPGGSTARLINLSENATYLIQAPCGFRAILRLHRPGYHSCRAIESELAWLDALKSDGSVPTPSPQPGRDGSMIQMAVHEDGPRHMVLFDYIEGHAPDETGDLAPGFEALGRLAALCHRQVLGWRRPPGFERLRWDEDSVFGAAPTWGNWRDAPGVSVPIRALLERTEETIRHRLHRFGKARERFNLIHADMRLANIIVTTEGPRLIDFDDCGFGWLMYDFAAAISFIEDDPRVPALKAAWLRGYRAIRGLGKEDEAEIDTFIMLRRMALLAWIGSHGEAPEPQALAPHFAAGTAEIAEAYLERFSAISPVHSPG